MEYRQQGVFEFPVGTVIAKTFLSPRHEASGSGCWRRGSSYCATPAGTASYIWSEEQTDARLALGGRDIDVQWTHLDGQTLSVRYQIPNANQCITCHSQDKKFVPIGPTAQNLNRPAPGKHASSNQLVHLVSQGQLDAVPSTGQSIPHWPRLSEADSGDIETRARAWLDVNCAHCHSPAGSARTSGLDLRWQQDDLAKAGLWKTPVAAGPGSGGEEFGIVPGKPDESILMYRLELG